MPWPAAKHHDVATGVVERQPGPAAAVAKADGTTAIGQKSSMARVGHVNLARCEPDVDRNTRVRAAQPASAADDAARPRVS